MKASSQGARLVRPLGSIGDWCLVGALGLSVVHGWADTVTVHLPPECQSQLPLSAVVASNRPEVQAIYLKTLSPERFVALRQAAAVLPPELARVVGDTRDLEDFMAKVKALPLTEATGLAPEHAAWWVANRLASEAADSFYHCANPGVLKLQPAEPLRSGDKIALRLVWTGPSVDGPIPVRWAAVNLEPERPLPETVDSSDDTVIVFERVGRQQVNLLVEAEVGNRVERAAFTDPGVTVKPETPSAR